MTLSPSSFLTSYNLHAFLPLAIAFFVSFAVTAIMVKTAIPDVPDYRRKQHKVPNPTAGGVGILAGIIVGALSAYGLVPLAIALGVVDQAALSIVKARLEEQAFDLFFLIGPLCGAVLGFVDDLADLKPNIKLAVMLIIASAIAFFRPVTFIAISGDGAFHLPLLLGVAGSILWILVVTNAVNFMDGSNGMAMGCAAIALFAFGHLHANASGAFDFIVSGAGGTLHYIGFAAILGFLPWNIWRGRIFAGDTGALGVGLLLASLGLALAGGLRVPVWAVALCLLPMLTDVILTVVWRLYKGHIITQAHRHHAYQVLLQSGMSHFQVGLVYWTLTSICCFFAVRAANTGHSGGVLSGADSHFSSFTHFSFALGILTILYYCVRRHARLANLNQT